MSRLSVVYAAALACAAAGCLSPARAPERPAGAFVIASFNVRTPGDTGPRAWYRRLPVVAEVVRSRGFDLFGVQEMTPPEAMIIEMELPEFGRVGCGREKNRGGEAMYVYYRKDRFDCLDNGTFWLSQTPDLPGSKYPGAGCPRVCTWAKLKDRVTGKTFRYFNTHLDHISSQARWDGMNVLLEIGVRPALARGETVLLTGDLNARLDPADDVDSLRRVSGEALVKAAAENPIALVATVLDDTIVSSETPHRGTFRTFHGYREEPRSRIDYIFASKGVRVLDHETVNDRPDGIFPSDHYPVMATVVLPGEK